MRNAIIAVSFVILIIAFLGGYYIGSKKINTSFVPHNNDSLYRNIDSLEGKKSILIDKISENKKSTVKIIKKYYEKDININSLGADSSLMLFAEWNRYLQDSSYSQRYFRINPDTIH